MLQVSPGKIWTEGRKKDREADQRVFTDIDIEASNVIKSTVISKTNMKTVSNRCFICIIAYFCSSARANIPAARGAEADVPV